MYIQEGDYRVLTDNFLVAVASSPDVDSSLNMRPWLTELTSLWK